ncbi:MAG: hypothetical protein KCHDKBKB_01455 [Elusimicrobia bacterium]|nr:hypothetical protein [Elusimicrobiota bacterium]
MYLMIEENPNCAPDERVFSGTGEKKIVRKLLLNSPHSQQTLWWDVAGVEEGGVFQEAMAQRVDDSSDGTAWLVYGGPWGLRLKPENSQIPWSFNDQSQWGVPFLVLDSSASTIQFK